MIRLIGMATLLAVGCFCSAMIVDAARTGSGAAQVERLEPAYQEAAARRDPVEMARIFYEQRRIMCEHDSLLAPQVDRRVCPEGK